MNASIDTGVRFILAALLSGLWQAPLFALAAWLVLRIRANANATTRHSVLAAALFASLGLPIVTAGITLTQHAAGPVRLTSDTRLPAGAPYHPPRRGASIPVRNATLGDAPAPSPALSIAASSRLNLAVPRTVALVIVGAWLAGALFALVRLGVSLAHLEALKRDALPLPVDYRTALSRFDAAGKGTRNVRLCRSAEIEVPIAVGLFDAMILLPERLLAELEPADIDSIILHELAHLRRADDWINALERVADALLFFNPGLRWIVAQLDLEREVACDDWVLQAQGALPYATALAKVVESTSWPFRAMTAPGAFVTRRGMSVRIERLLAKHRDVRIRTSLGPAGSAVAALAAIGIVAALVSPSIAYSVPGSDAAGAHDVAVRHDVAARDGVVARQDAAEHRSGRVTSDIAATSAARPAASSHEVVEASLHSSARPAEARDATARLVPAKEAAPRSVEADAKTPISPAAAARVLAQSLSTPQPLAPELQHTSVAPALLHATLPQPPHPPLPGHSVAVDDSGADAEAAGIDTEAIAGAARSLGTSLGSHIRATVRANLAPHDGERVVAEANEPAYIDEIANAGYKNLSVDDLIQLKSVGVTGAFIRDLERNGIVHPSISELVQLRAIGVDPAYVGAMRKRFGAHTDVGQIVGLKALNVSPDYVDALNATGLGNLTPDNARELRALGISPSYIRDLKSSGLKDLTIEHIQQLKALNIDGAFVAKARAHGFDDISVDKLIQLKATGIL
jgi:beta-lactamase regulating signal transducer with metallopeptidase domain